MNHEFASLHTHSAIHKITKAHRISLVIIVVNMPDSNSIKIVFLKDLFFKVDMKYSKQGGLNWSEISSEPAQIINTIAPFKNVKFILLI